MKRAVAGKVRGVTLVELALVLAIMGIVGLLLYSPIFDYMRKEKTRDGETVAEQAQSQLKGSAIARGFLPDPRPGDLLPASLASNKDPWGQDLRYWLAPELQGGGRIKPTDVTTLRLAIYAGVGSGGPFPAADAPLERTLPNLAFAVASLGPNQQQQITVSTAGGITTINVLKTGGPLNDGSGIPYDDIVRFMTVRELQVAIP